MFGCILGGLPMTETCDLCHSSALEPVYEPTLGRRGLMVCLCSDCGLVQSLPRAGRTPPVAAVVSSSADRNDVRAETGLSLIAAQEDLRANMRVLDVGPDSGSFAQAMLAAASGALMTCVGPDEVIPLPDAAFDIVRSCGMIEQCVSPASTLADLWRVLKPGGLIIIDAPNIARIGGDDIADEWFIDAQLYHFSERTLARFLKAAGFEILAAPDPKDRENLLFAARKQKRPARSEQRDLGEVDRALTLITSYVINRARTQRAA
jgi:SAM-dependent methyltransferase